MTWLNEYEIDDAVRITADSSWDVAAAAALTLSNLRDWTNGCSDGWAYWPKPSRASAKLQDIVGRFIRARWEGDLDPSRREVLAAYTPIKAFLTRQVRAGQVVTPGIIVELPDEAGGMEILR